MMTMRGSQVDRPVTDLMTGVSRRDRRRILSQMHQMPVAPGRELTHEGRYGREFYVVTDGRVDVTVAGEPVAAVEAGDFFGEIALLSGCRRTATVVAGDDVAVEVMNRREFASVLDLWPAFAQVVTRRAACRLYTLDKDR